MVGDLVELLCQAANPTSEFERWAWGQARLGWDAAFILIHVEYIGR